eukprot:scaffold120598_cov33-Phaeocystis_antarctica.AAC.1
MSRRARGSSACPGRRRRPRPARPKLRECCRSRNYRTRAASARHALTIGPANRRWSKRSRPARWRCRRAASESCGANADDGPPRHRCAPSGSQATFGSCLALMQLWSSVSPDSPGERAGTAGGGNR